MGTEEPPGRCFPARCGAAWGGYGAAWAAWGAPSRCPRTIRTSNRAFRVFTKHETRITAFCFPVHDCSPLFGIVRHCSAKNIVLRQSPRAARSLLSCALWRGMGGYDAAWAAWGAPSHCSRTIRTSNMTIRVFRKHGTRLLPDARQVPARIPRFSRDTNDETRITAFKLFFPRFPTISRHFPLFFGPPSPRKRCPSPVSRSRWVSRQAP